MKKTFTLSETDIKSVVAEKFKVDKNDVSIKVEFDYDNQHQYEPQVTIVIESEVQNYDL